MGCLEMKPINGGDATSGVANHGVIVPAEPAPSHPFTSSADAIVMAFTSNSGFTDASHGK